MRWSAESDDALKVFIGAAGPNGADSVFSLSSFSSSASASSLFSKLASLSAGRSDMASSCRLSRYRPEVSFTFRLATPLTSDNR